MNQPLHRIVDELRAEVARIDQVLVVVEPLAYDDQRPPEGRRGNNAPASD